MDRFFIRTRLAVRSMKDLLLELKSKGERAFLQAHGNPVLIGFGLAGKIERPAGEGGEAARTRVVSVSALCEDALLWKNLPIELRPAPGSRAANQVRVGRTIDMDVIIPDFSISRHQCTFERRGSSMVIRDASSRNGTLVGDRSASEAEILKGGEFITMGRLVFQYLTPQGLVRRLRDADGKCA